MTFDVFAPAKINLTLHVTGQRDDGYHLLDSLVVFADVGDRLRLTPASAMSMEVSGPFAAGVPADARNLAWQAAVMADWTGHIQLEKNLPHGAGIGGGSSDAAAVLRMLNGPQHAPALGADVAVCLAACAQRMRGIGDRLEVLDGLPPVWAVLVNPCVHVATPRVFAALQSKDNPPMPGDLPHFDIARTFIFWLGDMRNDLETAAISQAPAIADVLKALSETDGVHLARMSGSGATCFGLYDNQGLAELVARDLQRAHPDWWVQDCRLS